MRYLSKTTIDKLLSNGPGMFTELLTWSGRWIAISYPSYYI